MQDRQSLEKQAARGLMQRVAEAAGTDGATVRAEPGIYRFDESMLFELKGIRGLTLDGTDAEIVTMGRNAAIQLTNCERVTIRGFKFDRDPLPFSQGTIVEVNRQEQYMTAEIDEGYIIPGKAQENCRVMLWNAAETELRAVWCNDGACEFIPREGRRVSFRQNKGMIYEENTQIEIGDRVAFPFRDGESAIRLDGCCDCRVEDCDLYASNGFGIGDFSGEGGTVYQNVRIIPRPGTGRLMSVSADGFHSFQLHRAPQLIGCEISHSQDDLVNMHDFFGVVARQEADNVLILSMPYRYEQCARIGSTLEIYRMRELTVRDKATIVAAEYLDDNSGEDVRAAFKAQGLWMRPMDEGHDVRVTLDRPVQVERLDVCAYLDKGTQGAVIRNCHFHHGFVRGVMLRIPGSVVENNRFDNILGPAVYINAERCWVEGPFADDVTIKGNTIDYCGYGPDWYLAVYGAISVVTDPVDDPNGCFKVQHYHNLTVTDNTITRPGGAGILLANTDGARIEGNVIAGPWTNGIQRTAGDALKTPEPFGAVVAACSKNVTMADNEITDLPSFCTQLGQYDAEVKQL